MAKMTKTEARELRTLVRSEYGVLKGEISNRRAQVITEVREELLALDKSRLAVATNKIERLEAKAQKFKETCDKDLETVRKKRAKLDKEFEAVQAKYQDDIGKVNKKERDLREGYVEDAKDLTQEGKDLRKELEDDGFVFNNIRGAYHNDANAGLLTMNVLKGDISYTVAKDLETKDFKEKYSAAQRLIAKQATEVQSHLHREEQDMIRDLTLNTLESDEAVAFFHNMPTVNELIPAPDVKKLTA